MGSYKLEPLPPEEAETVIRAAQEYRQNKSNVYTMLVVLAEAGVYIGDVNPEDYSLADNIVRNATGGGKTIQHLGGARGLALSFLGI